MISLLLLCFVFDFQGRVSLYGPTGTHTVYQAGHKLRGTRVMYLHRNHNTEAFLPCSSPILLWPLGSSHYFFVFLHLCWEMLSGIRNLLNWLLSFSRVQLRCSDFCLLGQLLAFYWVRCASGSFNINVKPCRNYHILYTKLTTNLAFIKKKKAGPSGTYP